MRVDGGSWLVAGISKQEFYGLSLLYRLMGISAFVYVACMGMIIYKFRCLFELMGLCSLKRMK